jgi:hypothetical protein
MRRRYKYPLAICVLFAGLLIYFVRRAADSDGPLGPVERLVIDVASPSIAPNSYVGFTEAEIIREWGKPQKEWDGHYANPPVDYVKQNSPARTLLFRRWTGELYVSVKLQNGEWICFSSNWLRKGWAF